MLCFRAYGPEIFHIEARGEPPRIKINSGACEEGEGYTNDKDGGERASLWHLRGYSGHFRLTHVEEARRRGMRGMAFTFTRFSGRESEP